MRKNFFRAAIFVVGLLWVKPAVSQWQQLGSPSLKVPLAVQAVLIKGDSLLVGTYRGTIYGSTDGGKTWSPRNCGLSASLYETNALVSAGGTVFAATTDGVYMSTDWGNGWTLINSGLPSLYSTGVGTLARSNSTLYASTPDDGIYRRPISGGAWTPDTVGLWRSVYGVVAAVNSILVDDSLIVAATNAGVYRQVVGDSAWEALDLHGQTDAMAADGNMLFCVVNIDTRSIYSSSDFGAKWNDLSGNVSQVSSIAVRDSELLAGTSNGIFISRDNAQNWKSLDSGISGPPGTYDFVPELKFADNRFYAATFQGLYELGAGDTSWSLLFNHYPVVPSYNYFAAVGVNLVAGAYGSYYNGLIQGTYVSTDFGSTWSADSASPVSAFHNIIPAGNKVFGIDTGVFVSDFEGVSWVERDFGLPKIGGTNAVVESGGVLYAGYGGYVLNGDVGGVYRSTNGGLLWSLIGLKGVPVYSLAASGENVVALCGGNYVSHSLYRSTDGGVTWEEIDSALPQGILSTTLAAEGGTMFLGTTEGVYSSDDGGLSWINESSGLLKDSSDAYPSISLMYASPSTSISSSTLFTAAGSNLYRLSNSQGTWEVVYEGPAGSEGMISHVAAADGFIYVVSNEGIWRNRVTDLSSLGAAIPGDIPSGFVLLQNYPNPFNPSTAIQYVLPRSGYVSLKVYGVLGSEVATLVGGRQSAGTYSVVFNGSRLASGVYFYRLSAPGVNIVRKMLLEK